MQTGWVLLLFLFIIGFGSYVDGQKQEDKKCSAPDEMSKHPQYIQDEITKVWEGYTAGKDCDVELKITKVIMSIAERIEKEKPQDGDENADTADENTSESGTEKPKPDKTKNKEKKPKDDDGDDADKDKDDQSDEENSSSKKKRRKK